MKKTYSIFLLLVLVFFSQKTEAQDWTTPETFPENGVRDIRARHFALTNATIYSAYNQKQENATLIIKNGKVERVVSGKNVPKGAVEIDCEGKTIYPSFIELNSSYGLPEPPKSKQSWTDLPQMVSNKKGAYGWNEAIRPEMQAYKDFSDNEDNAKKLRELGFGTVVSHYQDGIARGSSVLATLATIGANNIILKEKVAAHYSFSKGSSGNDYPSSLMGAIALLRQTYLDGQWYKRNEGKVETNISLKYWNKTQELPAIFHAGDKFNLLRADKVGDEFGVQYILEADADAYQRAEAIKATNAKLILSVNFPDAYEVSDPYDAMYITLDQMKHWELAAQGPRILAEAGVDFAFTASDLKDNKKFLENIKGAVEKGKLSKETALKALTYNPANFVNAYNLVGSLESGKVANFIICNGDIFDKGEILENWASGEQMIFKNENKTDYKGAYDLSLDNNSKPFTVEITGEAGKQKAEIVVNDSTRLDMNLKITREQVSMRFIQPKDTAENVGFTRISGMILENEWRGNGKTAKGEWLTWTLDNKREIPKKEDKKELEKGNKEKEKGDKEKAEKEAEVLAEVTFPFLPYGWTEKPKQEAVLFKNVTVWTNEADGILEETDVLIKDGKIAKIGRDLPAGSATVIEGEGKHLTCGVIDEHSHIAISRGVNEGTQASSAEVRIGDVVNADDINIYRQLAGGVTTAQLLHGSANPIGGQSAIIKFRWGSTPEEMKFDGAPGFIKFALGENVKQSNWGDKNTVRFPQSRMGVEQVFVDNFTRAKEYGQKGSDKRTDLELECLNEIINKKRFISCHSYQQGEITMLMRVAEQFGFNINTFTHILEGYKVADKMKEHGVYASTFSDWWAYKFEVNDAIPHNGAILHDAGVLTGFNSDDAEMARRLNSEAAKAVKYGGVSEEEAWKFVTLNPAKMLHIDDKVGSVKVGKDADVVLWSGHPMSVYTKAEKTFVDGRCYFDIEEDEKMRQEISAERNRLIQKMLDAKAAGAKTQKALMQKQHLWHCNDMGEEGKRNQEFGQGGHKH